jgi:hypothetical protein
MSMIPEITAAVAAAAQTIKVVGGLMDTVHDAKTKEAISHLQNSIVDLQAKLFVAQAKMYELADGKREAEQKLATQKKWETEASRYALTELAPQIHVYALKPEKAKGEPSHYLCPNCFQEPKKSILQHPSAGNTNFICHACKFQARPVQPAMPQSVPRSRSRWLGGI